MDSLQDLCKFSFELVMCLLNGVSDSVFYSTAACVVKEVAADAAVAVVVGSELRLDVVTVLSKNTESQKVRNKFKTQNTESLAYLGKFRGLENYSAHQKIDKLFWPLNDIFRAFSMNLIMEFHKRLKSNGPKGLADTWNVTGSPARFFIFENLNQFSSSRQSKAHIIVISD